MRTANVRSLVLLALVPAAACFNPRDPLVVTASDDDDSGTSNDDDPGSTGPSSTTAPTTGMSSSESSDPDGSDGPDDATAGSSGGTEADGSSTSGEGGPLCGNGRPDEDEACDDANDVNGDGCNNDCVESGTVLWTVDHAEGYEVPETYAAGENAVEHVAVAPGGAIYVAAHITQGDKIATLVRALDSDGDTVWSDVVAGFGDDDYLPFGLTAADDLIVVCGFAGQSVFGNGFVQAYSEEGERVWDDAWDVESAAAARSCLVLPNGDVMVAGNDTFNAQIRRYDGTDGAEVWTDGSDDGLATSVALRSDGLIAVLSGQSVARFTENGVLASTLDLGSFDGIRVATSALGFEMFTSWGGESVFRRYDDDVLSWSHVTPAEADKGIGIDSVGNVVVAGREDDDIWVRKISTEGDELWTATYAGDGDGVDLASGVAIDADDNILVAGTEVTDAGRRGWLRKYAP